jgi:hypothetical protein
MKRSAFFLIFYLVISVIALTKYARAEDVYNFYFQKPATEKTEEKSEKKTEVVPQTATQSSPVLTPAQPSKYDFKLGFGTYTDTMISAEGVIFGYAKYFSPAWGLIGTFHYGTKYAKEGYVSMDESLARKFDIGFVYRKIVDKDLALAFSIGGTTIHDAKAWNYPDSNVEIGSDIFAGFGAAWSLKPNLAFEAEIKILPRLLFDKGGMSYGYQEKFSQTSLNLVWKI